MEAGGKKYDEGKLEWDMIPFEILEDLVRIYMMGRDKYDKDNWKSGILISRLFNAAMRHMLASWNGEDLDPESGLPHNIHAVWNLVAIEWMKRNRPDLDDRPNSANNKSLEKELIEKGWITPVETETCCKIKDLG